MTIFISKGLLAYYKMALHEKIAMPDLQRSDLQRSDLEDDVVFLGLKVFNYDHFYLSKCASNFFRETTIKIIILNNYEHWYPIETKLFKGTFVNRALSSLHKGSLEITLIIKNQIF